MNQPPLTVLSYSAGQDSKALLELYLNDPAWREEWSPREFFMIFSDTGDEHEETYAQLEHDRKRCQAHEIALHFLPSGGPWHTEAWASLPAQWERTSTVGSKAYDKTCTMNLKVLPIYRFLDHLLATRLGLPTHGRGKPGLYGWATRHGKIRMLIGIAAGEESRLPKPPKPKLNPLPMLPFDDVPPSPRRSSTPRWLTECVDRQYPLVQMGWDRTRCQEYIRSVGEKVPLPSNCRRCPFLREVEVLWLYRTQPHIFAEWVTAEARKLAKWHEKGEKNFTVWGTRETLPQVLARAERDYGHWTLAQLTEYKLSHGHAVSSAY